jgi:hypothetical protein
VLAAPLTDRQRRRTQHRISIDPHERDAEDIHTGHAKATIAFADESTR